MFNFTSSPTKTPPVSRAEFQFKPQSLRLIFPSMLKPTFVFPQGSVRIPLYSTGKVTVLETPLMFKSPVIS